MQPFLGTLACKTPQSNYLAASLTDLKQITFETNTLDLLHSAKEKLRKTQ